jgi:RNA polymerase sigma-70 factor (ECF subfamily)
MVTRAPSAGSASVPTGEFETYRRELTAYCYRMLGSGFEAEDAVQETMVRAWKAYDQFEGRSALRSWLYRIATNVCLDMRRGPQRRARPMDLGPSSTADATLGPQLAENTWVQPIPTAKVLPTGDPADLAAERDSIRLAFVAALQHLPPRQRAVLILREVLRWQATEVAELLDTSVASVNSALQRARATLAAHDLDSARPDPITDEQRDLVARYVDAFERYDMESLVALLHDDVVQSMPPWELWMQGPDQVVAWMLGKGIGCKDSRVLLAEGGNGCLTVGTYKPTGDGTYSPWSLQVLEFLDGRIIGLNNFIYPELFPYFGLPEKLDA